MKALSIHQPYAALICLPDDHPRAKRVENRSWPTSYRGEIAIHAGVSRARIDDLDAYPEIKPVDLEFGCILGVAMLIDCFEMRSVRDDMGRLLRREIPDLVLRRRPWLASHEHTEGPYCWVLTEVRPLVLPLRCRGKQGLWAPSAEEISIVRARLGNPEDFPE